MTSVIWILVVAMCQQKVKFFLSVYHSPRLLVSLLWLVYEFSLEYKTTACKAVGFYACRVVRL